MLVYRILLTQYSDKLAASGRAARWNPNKVGMIYTASSRSLACLENVVHRNKIGLSLLFNVLTIDCPDHLSVKAIGLNDLPVDWTDYAQMLTTQKIGAEWIKGGESAILQVPSSIISDEVNYLLNPNHPDFKHISVASIKPFVFDSRIKL